MKWLSRVLSVVLFLALGPVATAQQVYQSESKSWKFICPEGWQQIGFDVIKGREDAERAEWPDKQFKYIAGFTRGPMNTLTYPYILINRTDVDLTSVKYEDFEEGWKLPDEVNNERDLALGIFVYSNFGQEGQVDRDKVRLIAKYDDTDDQGKEFTIKLYTYLGKTQSIQFECYDLKERTGQNDGYFTAFVNSFEMRDDLRFVPTEGKSQFDRSNFKEEPKPRSSGRRGYGRYGFYGFGGIGVMVALLLLWLRRD
jgi:hypothetical protein